MAKQIIDSVNTKTPLSKVELDFIDQVRLNPTSPEYVELWLAGVID